MELTDAGQVTEIGRIPVDWRVRTLGDLGESLIGLTYTPRDVGLTGTLVLRSSNIQSGGIRFDDNVYVNCEVPDRILVRPDDILICVRNGSRELIGKCALLDHRVAGMTFGAFMAVFRASASPGFLFFQFQSGAIKKQIRQHLGATINQITNKSLNGFQVPVPVRPKEADLIGGALFDADSLIDSLEQVLAKKRRIKQGLMRDLLTAKKRLPGFDGAWPMQALSEVCLKIQDGTHFSPKPGGNDFLYITSKNVRDGVLDVSTADMISATEHSKIYARCDVRKGDVLLTKDGANTGRAALNNLDQPFSLLSSVAMLRVDGRKHSAEYLLYQLLSSEGQRRIRELVSGNAITRLTLAKIRSIQIPVPPIEEQVAIAAVLVQLDSEIAALDVRLAKSRQIKQGMMQTLLTGKIRLV